MIRTGGTSGNTLGGRLAEAGFRVAILEAGGFYEIGDALAAVPASSVLEIDSTLRNWNPLSDWGFLTTKQEGAGGRKLHYPRGKSSINALVYQRGTVDSYDKWAQIVGDANYKWDNILPYFMKSANFSAPDETKRFHNATTKFSPDVFSTRSQVLFMCPR